ncbi:transposase, partial [Leptospira levettii]|uniref:transposase n=1 Tax=Leptospira levettii TaxID=2023178 RepID=UPI003C6CEAD2
LSLGEDDFCGLDIPLLEGLLSPKPTLKHNHNSPYPYSPFLPKFSIRTYTKPNHNLSPLENEHIRKEYTLRTLNILSTIYQKTCNCPNSSKEPKLNFLKVKGRESIARCGHCQNQISLTANTPFQNIKLPLAYLSYIIQDQILQYPKVMTSREISRKLSIPYKTAFYLKKRIQVMYTQLNETLKTQLYKELEEKTKDFILPKEGDLKEALKNQPVAVADSVVLYSSSIRANKHRSRRYKGGTASIYLSNSLGGEQKGTLVHTVGINGGMTFYKSIPLNNQHYLEKDLNEKIPKSVTLFTDEGYNFLWDRPNHRSVNHSKKSNDARYNLSRERWVTKEGVSSNGAEARNNLLKQSFRSYGFLSCKWGQLALDEISFLGNVRFVPELKNLLSLGDSRNVGFGDYHCSKGTYHLLT